MTTLNATFENKLTLEGERYGSGSEISTYPLLSGVVPESTMYPVMTTSPLTPTSYKPIFTVCDDL